MSPMRAVAKAAPRPPIGPPPAYQEHEVTLRLDHHTYELAVWAYAYEQSTDERLHSSARTFEEFLADCVEAGLEFPERRWAATQT